MACRGHPGAGGRDTGRSSWATPVALEIVDEVGEAFESLICVSGFCPLSSVYLLVAGLAGLGSILTWEFWCIVQIT